MYSYLFAALLLIHGIIHIRGFFSGQGLWTIRTASGGLHFGVSSPRSRYLSYGWLFSCLALAAVAVCWALQFPLRGAFLIAAIIASQLMILTSWRAARAGTIVNLLLLFPALTQHVGYRQQMAVDAEVTAWRLNSQKETVELVTQERTATLPSSVQRWLSFSRVIGRPVPRFVHLKQQGWMHTGKDSDWMPTTAEQYFDIAHPSFLWYAKVSRHPLFYFTGRDRLRQGHGHMQIDLWSLLPVADSKGPEIDQGTMLRFLGELAWFPAAAVNPYLSWEGIDDSTARAVFTQGNKQVSGTFHFDQEGRLLHFRARRYMSESKGYSLQDWDIPAHSWRTFNGVMVPDAGDAIWHLKGGDLNYYIWQITDIDYE